MGFFEGYQYNENPVVRDLIEKRNVLVVSDQIPESPLFTEEVKCILFSTDPYCRMTFSNGSMLNVVTGIHARLGILPNGDVDTIYVTDESGLSKEEREQLAGRYE